MKKPKAKTYWEEIYEKCELVDEKDKDNIRKGREIEVLFDDIYI
jgi:hypothetical protein